jgi:hypothetical protein
MLMFWKFASLTSSTSFYVLAFAIYSQQQMAQAGVPLQGSVSAKLALAGLIGLAGSSVLTSVGIIGSFLLGGHRSKPAVESPQPAKPNRWA